MAGMVPIIQWNSKAGDLLSPRPAWCMGTSPPSAQALDVTVNAGPAGPLPPPFPPPFAPPGPPGAPPAGGCANNIAQNERPAIAATAVVGSIFFIMLDRISFSIKVTKSRVATRHFNMGMSRIQDKRL